jgi:hypothetical protein
MIDFIVNGMKSKTRSNRLMGQSAMMGWCVFRHERKVKRPTLVDARPTSPSLVASSSRAHASNAHPASASRPPSLPIPTRPISFVEHAQTAERRRKKLDERAQTHPRGGGR